MSTQAVICTYRVKSDSIAEFEGLLKRHWQTLRALDLTTEVPSQVFRGTENEGGTYFVELFTWVEGGANKAHQTPEVMAVWEPMGAMTEARGGRPAMEFLHVDPFEL